MRQRIYFAISVVLEKIRGSCKKFCNLSAGSLLNTQNKCLYSIRGTLSRSGGWKMDQFGFFHSCLQHLLFFFPPSKQMQLCCFQLPWEKNRGQEPAVVCRPLIITLKAWLVLSDTTITVSQHQPRLLRSLQQGAADRPGSSPILQTNPDSHALGANQIRQAEDGKGDVLCSRKSTRRSGALLSGGTLIQSIITYLGAYRVQP